MVFIGKRGIKRALVSDYFMSETATTFTFMILFNLHDKTQDCVHFTDENLENPNARTH